MCYYRNIQIYQYYLPLLLLRESKKKEKEVFFFLEVFTVNLYFVPAKETITLTMILYLIYNIRR